MANYASSDWHGAAWVWPQVKEFLNPDDTLYYLGDATGRCNQLDGGWNDFKEMLDDNRVSCLLGNHEDMLLDFMLRGDYYLCSINGEMSTVEAIRLDSEADKYAEKIKHLPLTFEYTRLDGKIIYMSHSGSRKTLNRHALLWDRKHYFDSNPPNQYDYVIMGHTNVRYINSKIDPDEEPIAEPDEGACWIYPWLIDIDCLTIRNHHTTLLDLDTFKQFIISPSGIKELI